MRAPQTAVSWALLRRVLLRCGCSSGRASSSGGATPVRAPRQGAPLADASQMRPKRLLLRRVLRGQGAPLACALRQGAPLADASQMRLKRLLLRRVLCGQGAPLACALRQGAPLADASQIQQGAPLAYASPIWLLLCSFAKFVWLL